MAIAVIGARHVPLRVIGAVALVTVAALAWPRVQAEFRSAKEIRSIRARITSRLESDLARVRTVLATAGMNEDRRLALGARLNDATQAIASMPDPDISRFTTVLPLNAVHERILAVHGGGLMAAGLPPLVVWKTHRYDAVPLVAVPGRHAPDGSGASAPAIDIAMMSHEYRADAILVTNASEERAEIRLRVTGLPGAPQPKWLKASGVEWTDTREGEPAADALTDLLFANGTFQVMVPAGMTRKVWLTVDSSLLAPGSYQGDVSVESGASRVRVPTRIAVSRVAMARPRLSLAMWDYSHAETGPYGITPANRDAAIALMRSHFVDSPWATSEVLPWPAGSDFDARDALAHPLDFTRLDDWVRRWPDARRYYVFANVKDTFAGTAIDTEAFTRRVAAWGQAVARHASALGFAQHQLSLLLVDEPRTREQDVVVTAWTKALERAAPGIGVFEDPNWPDPADASPESLTLVDEICVHLGIYSRGGDRAARYYESRRAAGQRLWLYQTSGPARRLDPTTYYRLAGWYAFRMGAIGTAFWAFGDTGGAETSWNEYAGSMTRMAYAPAFLGKQDAADSVHWQAVREGIEDYEYLAMLRDAAALTRDDRKREAALTLLANAKADVPLDYTGDFDWDLNPRHQRPDDYRVRMLALLESMR